MSLSFAKIVTGVIVFIMAILFSSPLSLVSFYIVFRPLVQPFAYLHYRLVGGIPLTSVFAIFLIITAFFNAVFKKENTVIPPNTLPLYLLLFFSSLSFLNTLNYMTSIGHILKILTGLSLYLLVYNSIRSKRDARKILYALAISTIIPALFGYYQYVTETGHAWKTKYSGLTGKRIDSFLGEFNAYGIFLCLAILATTMLFLEASQKTRKIILIGLIFSMLVSLVLSLNRGSWLALCFGIVVGLIFYRREVNLRWIAAIGIALLVLFSSMIFQRFQELEDKTSWGTSKNTFSGRVEHWKAIVPLIGMHPITGFGIGTASDVTMKFLKNDLVPHNDYLRLALEVGVPASLFYVLFLFREFCVNIKRTFDKKNWFINFPMLAAIAYFALISLTQNIIYNVINFPMLLSLMGVSRKWNVLDDRGSESP